MEEANRTAHEQLLGIVEDDSDVVSTTGGNVTIDLKQILGSITENLGVGAGLVSKLPEDGPAPGRRFRRGRQGPDRARRLQGRRLVFGHPSAGPVRARRLSRRRPRRRETLRAVGIGFIVVGAAVLLGHRAAGNAVVGALSETASADDAVAATWEIGTTQLTEIGHGLILYGILIDRGLARRPDVDRDLARGAVTPWFRRPAYAYGSAVALLLVLFLWDPTPATHRLIPSLLLIVLVLLGTEVLRRRVIREFPDRVTTGSSAGSPRRSRGGCARRASACRCTAAPAPAGDARIAEEPSDSRACTTPVCCRTRRSPPRSGGSSAPP